MNKEELEKLLEKSIEDLLGGDKGFEKQVNILIKKHERKTHFIPIKYRVLGGFLQSLNIKFGNFIEILLTNIINSEDLGEFKTIKEISGKKNISIERFHNNLRQRTKTFRGFHGSIESANTILKGFEIYYNFITKHQTINKCPYELATDIKLNSNNKWLELINLANQKV